MSPFAHIGLIMCVGALMTPACANESNEDAPGMRSIPGGYAWIGCSTSLETACEESEGPRFSLTMPAFLIDTHEVSVSDYLTFLNTHGNSCGEAECAESFFEHSPVMRDGEQWVARDARESHPMTAVSWYGAEAYCEHVAKRLCSEFEWEVAALGYCTEGNCEDTKARFPWGDDDASCQRAHMVEGDKGCGTDTTAPVGSYPAGQSPFGVQDMAGNAWEWTADTWRDSYDGAAEAGPGAWVDPSVPFRVVRGGGFGSGPDRVRSSHRFNAGASDKPAEYGFRCCR